MLFLLVSVEMKGRCAAAPDPQIQYGAAPPGSAVADMPLLSGIQDKSVTTMHITILVPGYGLPSAVIGPVEVFRTTGLLWNTLRGEALAPAFEVVTASEDGATVEFEGGVAIRPDTAVSRIRATDLVYVPTIGLDTDTVIAHRPGMLRLLQRQARRGGLVAGVCTGVALLAEAGLLDGRPATTHWAIADAFRARYPAVHWQPELFITESDNLFCGGGVYAALDLCLHLVERLAGYEAARHCGRALLIDAPRTWQAGYAAPLLAARHQDPPIRRVQDSLHERFREPVTVDALARAAGMSPRNFTRRFKQATGEPPLAYLHKLRIDAAKHLLEAEFKTVQQVCYEVGYEDQAHFRKLFRRHTGLTPTEYKARFGGRRRGASVGDGGQDIAAVLGT
jgi:transcriptional regulator GlxA family with amidase domain